MKIFLRVFKSLLILLAFCSNAQEPDSNETDSTKVGTYRLVTKDGNQYVGTLVRHTQDTIILKTKTLGTLKFSISQISSFDEVIDGDTINGWPYHFQTTNYFTLNNGYGLKQGEGYYKNIWILFNNFSYGVTDNFSMGVGTFALFLFGETSPIWVTARLTGSVIENKLSAGGGVIYGATGDESFGIIYGVTTLGSRDRNVSIGLGSGFSDSNLNPYLNISANIRVGPKLYLLGESYILDEEGLVMFGARSMLGRSSLEYGILRVSDIDFFGIPILGVTLPLHK